MRGPSRIVLFAACALTVGILCLPTLASAAADSRAGPPVVRRAVDVALPVDAETLDRQYRALSSMPSVEVVYSALGPVRSLNGATGIQLSRSTRDLKEGQGAPEVLEKFRDVLLAAGSETLKVRLNRVSEIGRTIRMDQFINGVPVLYGTVSVGIDDATGLVNGLGATFLPDRGLPRQPKISEADAIKRVEQLLVERGIARPGSVRAEPPTLAYTGTHPQSTRGHLVWAVPATYTPQAAGPADGIFWIDAIDGALVGQDSLSKGAALKVDTGNNDTGLINSDSNLPSALTTLFTHPGSSTDQLAMNAYNNLLPSLSVDEVVGGWLQLSELRLTVHVGSNWGNARATRKSEVDYLLFGDGSSTEGKGPYGNSRDVVAHEYGHVIANLMFDPLGNDVNGDVQSAAIDEAFGDVNAALVDTHMRGGLPAGATWTIGEVFTSNPAQGLRSMADPKSMALSARDWFPARLTGHGDDTRHANATIMGHAFKLMANPPSGGFHVRAGQPIIDSGVSGNIPSLFVAGLGPAKTWTIFFRTFDRPEIGPFVDLPTVRAAAKSVANLLYGAVDADSVDRAFLAVGVGNSCSAPPSPPQMEAVDRCPRWLLRWPVVPGATIYHAQASPQAWGWFSPTIIVDGNANECRQRVTTWTQARVRACNGCGCSSWSNEVTMFPWASCP